MCGLPVSDAVLEHDYVQEDNPTDTTDAIEQRTLYAFRFKVRFSTQAYLSLGSSLSFETVVTIYL